MAANSAWLATSPTSCRGERFPEAASSVPGADPGELADQPLPHGLVVLGEIEHGVELGLGIVGLVDPAGQALSVEVDPPRPLQLRTGGVLHLVLVRVLTEAGGDVGSQPEVRVSGHGQKTPSGDSHSAIGSSGMPGVAVNSAPVSVFTRRPSSSGRSGRSSLGDGGRGRITRGLLTDR
jgi:hypothetical protein